MELAQASLNAWTVKDLPLADLLARARARGFGGVAPWLETIAPVGPEAAARMIADSGLAVSSVCRGGFFPADDAGERRRAVDATKEAIDVAAAIGAPTLVVLPGGLPSPTRADGVTLADARRHVAEGLAACLDHARGAGVRLGLEPLHPMMAADRSVVCSLEQANDVIDELDDDALGLVVDIYHCWFDHALERELARAGERVLGVHLSDWVLPLGGHLSSRGMIGDGCIDLTGTIGMARRHGYTGLFEIEVLSDRWWAENPVDVVDLVADRWARLPAPDTAH
ncbi:sugar phosphate isomerase/epimerase family protein [Georgenia thermotolerans]|uniref:TIM barrel protein n=1 Tax=Georgenia thermotolerans TaxID=527326 RepID=A0A7J5USJ5_9MICO|nr:sugar phosphate isomerase/epimerase family protein [Georgenia thermotolerans]KAE8764803.1 TIM barrel protein [Georgenia thermotolerans]